MNEHLLVGIDVGCHSHQVAIAKSNGTYLKEFGISHNASGFNSLFSKKYNLNKLVYYEVFSHPYEAINREKKMKSLKRTKKIQLITAFNPEWEDLYEKL
jgi:predicted GIY-YIG superfamily endonuclease